MRRTWLLPIAVGAIAGAMTFASAASLTVTSKDLTVLSITATPPPTGDTTAPVLVSLEMFDIGGGPGNTPNGKVDRVVATFNETLAPYSAGNGPWTLTSVPSGGTLSSVSVSGQAATLTLTEGAGTADTAVGSFTVALAANANGIRDAAGNQSSFAATAPADKAAPAVIGFSADNGGNANQAGEPGRGDFYELTFSEVLDATGMCGTWTNIGTQTRVGSAVQVILADNGTTSDRLTVSTTSGCTLSIGRVDLGDGGYVDGTGTFSGNNPNDSRVTWDPTARTLTVRLGTSSGSFGKVASNSVAQTYVPSSGIRDTAGNVATTSHQANFRFF